MPPAPRIEVRIADALTGAPISGARVFLSSNGVSQPMQTTDASGLWTGEVLAGRHQVRAQAPGFLDDPQPFFAPAEVTIAAGGTGSIALGLDPRPNAEAGSIEGRVTQGGQGAAGVLVIAIATVERAALTDADGRFVLFDLPAGEYRVEARLAGHAAEALTGVRVPNAAGEVALELAPAAGVAVSGTLGPGAAATEVVLTHAGTGTLVPGLVAQATPESGFSIAGVAPGRYLLRSFLEADALVQSPDLIRELETLEIEVAATAPAPIEIPAAPSIALLSPTASSTLGPALEFAWTPHPEATFYVVEVKNASGQLLWGGFDARGVPRFRVLGSTTRIRYGAQGSPTESLELGHLYQFRVYAGLDVTTGEIFKLIGASEELAGRFRPSGL